MEMGGDGWRWVEMEMGGDRDGDGGSDRDGK